MRDNWLLAAGVFAFVILAIALLAWLTLPGDEDPCAQQRSDVGAAVLADEADDQDALINRAIILRGKCEKPEKREKDQ
ncbi:MAG: hypothetical protein KDI01_04315 [Halioglobus sp.]|nr:hypothetical protein [Halioglobus sp.]